MPPYSSISLHPSTHQPLSLPTRTYDVICIGSGWASRVAGTRLARAGQDVLIVERELVGGDCPFWACMPSKALLRGSELMSVARRVAGVREKLGQITDYEASVNVEAILAFRDQVAMQWNDEKLVLPGLESAGVHIARGIGRISSVKRVTITAQDGTQVDVEAKHAVVIGTGSEIRIPDVPGLRESNPWGPRQATSSSEIPSRLTVIGSGAVGCEMATAYKNFGAEVFVVTSSSELLSKLDPEAGKLVRKKLTSQGVIFHLSTSPTKVVDASQSGYSTVHLANGVIIENTRILLAAGRTPQTSDIGLHTIGMDKAVEDFLPVDDSLAVKGIDGGWLYAGGDVNGRAPLTHMSKYHGRIISNAILRRLRAGHDGPIIDWDSASATADVFATPQVIFTEPTVASVGMTRTAAVKAGKQFREVIAPVITAGASIYTSDYEEGWAQWIIDNTSNVLLGATFVGENVGELLHASTLAVVGGVPLEKIAHAVPSFPTMSEVYLNLLEAAGY